MYVGHRYVLPGQNTNNWVHNYRGVQGVYSNYSLMSDTHLLQGAPLRNHRPGDGYHPSDVLTTQMYLGDHRYAPMELEKYSHGGQKWSVSYDNQFWQLHKPWEYNGVPSGEVFHSGEWGYAVGDTFQRLGFATERNFEYSRHSNLFFFGVPSTVSLLGGRPYRTHAYRSAPDEGVPHGFGRIEPHQYHGVGDDVMEDPGDTHANRLAAGAETNAHAFQRTQEWHGVPSSKAL